MIKYIAFFTAISVSINLCQSQSLSIDETITYINKTSRESPSEGKFYDVISISNDGYIKFESWVLSKDYQRGDIDDPFNPINFNAKNNVTGSAPSIKIPLSEENGVFTISATIGNTTLKFVFDSGASETSISSDVERQLINNKVITKSN